MQNLRTFFDVRQTLEQFLQEDIRTGDITSRAVISARTQASAEIVCRSRGKSILAGVQEAETIFELAGCEAHRLRRDGSILEKGSKIMRIEGDAHAILKGERTALNLLMRMSGIATQTRALVNGLNGKISILATRKTAPGLRAFDKKAVVVGGGKPHRMGLDDLVLIKDNHIKLVGSASLCVRRARQFVGQAAKIECEVTNIAEAISAALAGADIIMLDNFTPIQAKRAVHAIQKQGLRKKVQIEISGGITSENIRNFVIAGADYISLGSLTHSPRAVDFSMEIC